MADIDKLVGAPVVAIWHRTLAWAVDELAKLERNQVMGLKVRSGEHLAAILTTAFLRIAPVQIDTRGGVDLLFRIPEGRPGSKVISPGIRTAAFEVKSARGRFREFESELNRIHGAGRSAIGRNLKLRTQSAHEILTNSRDLLESAQASLIAKIAASSETSRNIFLVVHPFDALAVDIQHPVLGPVLPDLGYLCEVDSVWVLWAPDRLAMWSTKEQGWIDLLFGGMNEDDEISDLPPLQDAEVRFLNARGDKDGSPYLFKISTAKSP
ncbi:hypothetical protein [Corallococcus interemptor]|uniref:hypothetical protein n=1 Tax=Corallococcus interemptor TaxID=2316720 RepID=UPI0011C4537E|nr:hypothetical protein [Corallococcus interemptor]